MRFFGGKLSKKALRRECRNPAPLGRFAPHNRAANAVENSAQVLDHWVKREFLTFLGCSHLRLSQPTTSELFCGNSRQVGLDIEDRSRVEHVDSAHME